MLSLSSTSSLNIILIFFLLSTLSLISAQSITTTTTTTTANGGDKSAPAAPPTTTTTSSSSQNCPNNTSNTTHKPQGEFVPYCETSPSTASAFAVTALCSFFFGFGVAYCWLKNRVHEAESRAEEAVGRLILAGEGARGDDQIMLVNPVWTEDTARFVERYRQQQQHQSQRPTGGLTVNNTSINGDQQVIRPTTPNSNSSGNGQQPRRSPRRIGNGAVTAANPYGTWRRRAANSATTSPNVNNGLTINNSNTTAQQQQQRSAAQQSLSDGASSMATISPSQPALQSPAATTGTTQEQQNNNNSNSVAVNGRFMRVQNMGARGWTGQRRLREPRRFVDPQTQAQQSQQQRSAATNLLLPAPPANSGGLLTPPRVSYNNSLGSASSNGSVASGVSPYGTSL